MATREQSTAATYAACAIDSWTTDDEREHREMLRTDPRFGMFWDHRRKRHDAAGKRQTGSDA